MANRIQTPARDIAARISAATNIPTAKISIYDLNSNRFRMSIHYPPALQQQMYQQLVSKLQLVDFVTIIHTFPPDVYFTIN